MSSYYNTKAQQDKLVEDALRRIDELCDRARKEMQAKRDASADTHKDADQ